MKTPMKALIAFAIAFSAGPAFAQSAPSSAFTSLKSCETIKSSENDPAAEIDSFESLCIGRSHFKVYIEGGDSRSWLKLVKGSHTIDLQNVMNGAAIGQFPNVAGKMLEWRYHGDKLVALIVRVSGLDADSQTSHTELLVIGINGYEAKALGHTSSNDEAREIADRG